MLLKGGYFEKRFTAHFDPKGKDRATTPCSGVEMISEDDFLLYEALDKRLTGFTSSSHKDFNFTG